jgi:hypothetical protein
MTQIVGNKYICRDLLGFFPIQTARVISVDANNNPTLLRFNESTPGLRYYSVDPSRYLLGDQIDA